ncbi:DNA polymerase IV [Niastella yeongjuensis]|uniref:DNA polymerase IV n=1 Tax=Niastella yeongjuensis TaxID=354355 RepID=A0A1V9F0D2_9BACT|nr:DNA polymerase IV [Niastella yeongjuensis]OQP51809.1 DNA polymerase IV [Niastella yeongjuensis]SEP44592.1 DNA polymerase-4 [Niastella yeongjuensis]
MLLSKDRHIAHFDLDAFFVSVETLRNPKFRGKPLLVGGGSDRGVVAACSYEARKFGIHSAMPMKIARRLCPEAIVVRSDMEAYSKYSHLVTAVIKDTVPVFEKASIDEFYIDLTGMDKFFGCLQFTDQLKKKINKESGLPISWGLASNKLISKVATNEVKPNGQLEIPFGNEKSFLAPLSVIKIPGVGKETGYKLLKMGVETVKVLSEIPMEMMENLLGKSGIDLWRKANGIDETPVVPYHEQKSISTESTFQTDTIDTHFLHSQLVRMTEEIAFQLRQQSKLTGCVTVKVRYSNFETFTKQITIPYTNADHVLLQTAKELFNKLYERRLLIRLLGIRFTHLIPGNYQISLFEDTQEMIKLYQAIDSVKKRFGEKTLIRAVGIGGV